MAGNELRMAHSDVELLLRHLESPQAAEREVAREALKREPRRCARELIACLSSPGQLGSCLFWLGLGGASLVGLAIAAVLLVPLILIMSLSWIIPAIVGMFAVAIAGALAVRKQTFGSLFTANPRRLSRDRERVERALEQIDDVSVVGDLLDALPTAFQFGSGCPYRMLTRLLPRLREEHSQMLTRGQKRRLYGLLSMFPGSASDFHVAVLRATARIGDAEALPHVWRIASGTPTSPSEERIRATALDCLNVLEERVKRMRQGRALLRPSDEPAADTLLRAAGQAESAPRHLLRPADGSSE